MAGPDRAGGTVRSRRSEQGVALILVLWAVVLLSALTVSFSASTRTEMDLARNTVENARAEALAEAGLNRVLLGLLGPPEALPFSTDGTAAGWSFEGGEILFAVQDEAGKIDLNEATPRLLAALFQAVGLDDGDAEALAEAVDGFRGRDPSARASGFEDGDGDPPGLSAGVGNRPFEHVNQLALVEGMTASVFRQVVPAVTVHARREEPAIEQAPPLVRAAMDLYGPGTGEGGPRFSPDRGDRFGGAGRSLEERPDEGPVLRGSLQDLTFSIHVEGRTPAGSVMARTAVVAITDLSDSGYLVLSWGQGRRRLFADAAAR